MNKTLVIGICTRQRDAQLLRLLASLNAQMLPHGWTAEIIVVDNNDDPSVHDIVTDIDCFCPISVVHEPRAGLVNARNHALDLAQARDAEWFIGLDDDEWVADDWLAHYCQALSDSSGVPIRMGPCTLVFAPDASQFLTRPAPVYVAAGRRPRALTTQNFAIHRSVFDSKTGVGLRFHMAFNETGGEDSEFFRRGMRLHGFQAGSVPDAMVFEDRKDDRATLRYRLFRTLRNQISLLRIDRMHQQEGIYGTRGLNAKRIAALVLRNIVRLLTGLVVGVGLFAIDREKALQTIGKALQHGARVVAVVRFLLGSIPVVYGKSQKPT